MRRLNIISFILVTVLCSISAVAQPKWIRKGVLPNGLTYYLAKTSYTPDEVNFYLYQNVGAILEGDKQQGLAHYLEHMAFNATEHFPRGVMSFFLERGLNSFDAKTGINETRYQISGIPISDKLLVDSVMLVLKDWCSGITILSKDVEKERNIITEEWRQRSGVDRRLTDAIAPVIYNGAKYAERNVIGPIELIRRFSAKDLKAFYKQWYRPDLQSIMVIGDIDLDQYEAKVKHLFGSIKAPKKPTPRKETIIADNDIPLYFRFVDKENDNNSFGLYQRVHLPADEEGRDYTKESVCIQIYNRLAPRRFALIRNEGAEASLMSTVSYDALVRSYYQNAWDVVPYAGREIEALEQMLSVREWIRRDGFSEEEFNEIKSTMYDDIQGILQQGGLEAPDNLMDAFKQNYLYNTPIKSMTESLSETMETLAELEVEDFNKWVASWTKDKNLAFITYSSKSEDMNISLEDFQKALAKVKAAPTMKLATAGPISGDIIDYEIPAGKIVSEKHLKDIDVKEWTLSNGARVLYKNVPEISGRFYFVASSRGGRSVIEPKDLPSYSAMQALVMRSGIYKYNRNQLHNWLKSKDFELSLSLSDYTEGLGGNAAVANSEDFFKYVHLLITKQNFDKSEFDKHVERKKYLFNSKSTVGMTAVQDSIMAVLYPESPYNPHESIEYFDKMKHADLKRLFDSRFGNAGDFIFCVIGDIAEDKVKDLITRYVASLPGAPLAQPEKYRYMDFSSPEKEIIREFHTELEGDSGEVEISFSNAKDFTRVEANALTVLESILQNRFFKELREKEGGVYSIGVKSSYVHQPRSSASLSIKFSTQRAKVDQLKKKAYEIFESVLQGDFTEDEFKNAHIPMVLHSRGNAVEPSENPLLWLVILNSYVEDGVLPDLKADFSPEHVENVTRNDVINAGKKLMDGAKKREIVVKAIAQPSYGRTHTF
ncbi:pitrilysin family protein [Porphyromonas sp.]|uniref:M16 family metallopeptidase n=1 Tax=Porphyromonas sp. TaxID=1924944 RepID=UPI0026DCBD16|nr:insulinase family protein [Porphyromonas sp.]MDO4771518.1 insulinase family protein [Porphyromonas sp.]